MLGAPWRLVASTGGTFAPDPALRPGRAGQQPAVPGESPGPGRRRGVPGPGGRGRPGGQAGRAPGRGGSAARRGLVRQGHGGPDQRRQHRLGLPGRDRGHRAGRRAAGCHRAAQGRRAGRGGLAGPAAAPGRAGDGVPAGPDRDRGADRGRRRARRGGRDRRGLAAAGGTGVRPGRLHGQPGHAVAGRSAPSPPGTPAAMPSTTRTCGCWWPPGRTACRRSTGHTRPSPTPPGCSRAAASAAALGFDGKWVLHPSQIDP